jgi:hypothetical protein
VVSTASGAQGLNAVNAASGGGLTS